LQLEPIDRFRSGLIIAQEKVLASRDGDDGDPFFDSALAPLDADDEAGSARPPPTLRLPTRHRPAARRSSQRSPT